ncbi:LacI family DNA-binding transcriptional regulator [Alicyclobacillus acidiphilus]|uniref:LacI family DNA-binding transcriptional regulator n=1 Tax=Alicyclobacillus acidiphilus TaxID=182455 RepID=UPI0009FB7A27|nr:LacI family DNA-binding transcriptional regulator [Alicyclobacillus acidiphilus]
MPEGHQRPTIDLVARQANVSKTTVSRFLNGKFEFMSEETRRRIQRVVDELNYRPSQSARSLKSKRSGLIGVIVADIGSPFSSILVKAIGDLCNELGFHMIIADADENPAKEREALESLVGDERVEGLIVNTTGYNDDTLVELGKHCPIVIVEREMETLVFDTVVSDSYSMTMEAMRHMDRAGFDAIAFFTQPIGRNSVRRNRLQAYLDFWRANRTGDAYVFESPTSDVQRDLQAFLAASQGRSRSIFSVNGVTTLAILKSAAALGVRIPADIGLCGYDDWAWAALIGPGITTIDHPTYQVGSLAAKRLVARIMGAKGKPKRIKVPSTLHVRGSTAR